MTVWRRLPSSHDGFPSSNDGREGITVISNHLIIKENDSYDGNDSTSPLLALAGLRIDRGPLAATLKVHK